MLRARKKASFVRSTKNPATREVYISSVLTVICRSLRLYHRQCTKIKNFVRPLHAAPHNAYLARDHRGQS